MVVRKMKEKCKDAARMRREKERAEFVELSKLLPLPSSTTNQLDKASIIRLTSSYLRMRSAFPRGLGESWGEQRHQQRAASRSHSQVYQAQQSDLSHGPSRTSAAGCAVRCETAQQQIRELGSLILQTLDGFVFALHRDGKIMYISETASVHLGLPQIDLSGSSVFEYTHQADHGDLVDILSLSEADRRNLDLKLKQHQEQTNEFKRHDYHFELGRSFCMRMKCILPKRNAGLVSNGYKAIHCSGYLKVRRCSKRQTTPNCSANLVQFPSSQLQSEPQPAGTRQQQQQQQCDDEYDWESYALVAVGHSLLPTASTEVKLNNNSFMFRANLDLRLYYVEPPIIKLLGYQQADLVGQSLYQFVHLADVRQLEEAHRALLRKGQIVSRYFRLMRQTGGHIWLQIHATLINNPRSMPKPQHIVSICSIIGVDQLEACGQTHLGPSVCLIEQSSRPSGARERSGAAIPAITPHLAPADDEVKGRKNSRMKRSEKFDSKFAYNKRRIAAPRRNKNIKTFFTLEPQPDSSGATCANLQQNRPQVPLGETEQQYRIITYPAASSSTSSPTSFTQGFISSDNSTTNHHLNLLAAQQSIGSTRRASDDSCSVVSSVVSAFSSSSTSSIANANDYNHQQNYYQPIEAASVVIENSDSSGVSTIFKAQQTKPEYNTDRLDNGATSESASCSLQGYHNFYSASTVWPNQPMNGYNITYGATTQPSLAGSEQYNPAIAHHHHYYQEMEETPISYQSDNNNTYFSAAGEPIQHNHRLYGQHYLDPSFCNSDQVITQYHQQTCVVDGVIL